MIIDRVHHEIKLRYNKINSNHKLDLPSAYLDDIVNTAYEDFVDIFYSGNNSKQYKFGFEVTQQRIDMLQHLVVTTSVTPVIVTTNVYEITLPSDYRYFLSGFVDLCNSNIFITRHGDINRKLKDFNTKPSKQWQRCLGVFENGKLILYTDGIISNVRLTYLKNPPKVFFGGYDTLEYISGNLTFPNNASPKQHLDFTFADMVVDMAVQRLSMMLQDQNTQLSVERQILNKT